MIPSATSTSVRDNREFARKQVQKHRETLAHVKAELYMPKSLRRYATKAMEEKFRFFK